MIPTVKQPLAEQPFAQTNVSRYYTAPVAIQREKERERERGREGEKERGREMERLARRAETTKQDLYSCSELIVLPM